MTYDSYIPTKEELRELEELCDDIIAAMDPSGPKPSWQTLPGPKPPDPQPMGSCATQPCGPPTTGPQEIWVDAVGWSNKFVHPFGGAVSHFVLVKYNGSYYCYTAKASEVGLGVSRMRIKEFELSGLHVPKLLLPPPGATCHDLMTAIKDFEDLVAVFTPDLDLKSDAQRELELDTGEQVCTCSTQVLSHFGCPSASGGKCPGKQEL